MKLCTECHLALATSVRIRDVYHNSHCVMSNSSGRDSLQTAEALLLSDDGALSSLTEAGARLALTEAIVSNEYGVAVKGRGAHHTGDKVTLSCH